MSTTLAPRWRNATIAQLPSHYRHRQTRSPVAPGFIAPRLPSSISFGPRALAASIGRTSTLLPAPPELLVAMTRSALHQLAILIVDNPTFELSQNITYLADSDRSGFAGRVGAGIADIVMEAMGYKWRDNATILSKTLNPHADFIYGGGSASMYGVVLAEARGSFAASTSQMKIEREAKAKYKRQVKRFIGGMSCHGKVIHGYSVGFGATPGMHGNFAHISETKIKRPSTPSPIPDPTIPKSSAPTQLALSTYRSNFILLGSPIIAHWVDSVRGSKMELDADEELILRRIKYASKTFHILPYRRFCSDDLFYYDAHDDEYARWRMGIGMPYFRGPFGVFGIEEKTSTAFLNQLSKMIGAREREIPSELEIPGTESYGISAEYGSVRASALDVEAKVPASYVLFSDGLALLGNIDHGNMDGYISWSPRQGVITFGRQS